MIDRNRLVSMAFPVCLLIALAAFDTAEDHEVAWHSAYLGVVNRPGEPSISNEHSFLSHLALRRIGVADRLGLNGDLTLTLTDLNASVFRADSHGLFLRETKGDDNATLLEERLLPTPSHFSGLPDYSYTLYDWANKNDICPLTVKAYPEKCHKFQGWMGAMNANHFGSQAAATYRHFHELAVNLAKKAKLTRETVLAQVGAQLLPSYRDYLREMEAMAFVYEGIAQHYLQDRWSTGHMWERWNGSDMKTASGVFWRDFLIGVTTGIIHGHQSISDPGLRGLGGFAERYAEFSTGAEVSFDDVRETISFDMLSSPQVIADTYLTADWRFGQGTTLYPGIGDKRVIDLLGSTYRGSFLNVARQEEEMLNCLAASWASVIRATGRHHNGSGYGIEALQMSADAPDFDPSAIGHQCTDVWVTNDSIYRAWLDDYLVKLLEPVMRKFMAGPNQQLDSKQILSHAGKLLISSNMEMTDRDTEQFLNTARAEFTRLTALLAVQRRLDGLRRKNGLAGDKAINLAQGGIGSFAGRPPGNQFAVAEWAEPLNLQSLPARDDVHGRDKQSLFGLFSRAGIDNWCHNPDEVFNAVRSRDIGQTKRLVEACAFVADMMYQGTQQDYEGASKEIRTVDRREGSAPTLSLCRLSDSDQMSYAPIYLMPGYVSFDPSRTSAGPYESTSNTYRSVYNWCRRIPVLIAPKNNKDDVVASGRPGEEIMLKGVDLGEDPGTVAFDAYLPGGAKTGFFLKPDAWRETEIALTLPGNVPPGSYCIRVRRSDLIESEGRFVVRVKAEAHVVDAETEIAVGSGHALDARIGGKFARLDILAANQIECPAP